MLNHNLYLSGFMGSGKSHVGKALAVILEAPFVDLDVFIEKEAQCSIAELFATEGEAYFRELEAISLRKLKEAKSVISLGGGTPCFLNNADWIHDNGDSFYLDVPVTVLVERLLGETEKRPLLKGKSKEELVTFIEHKLKERRSFYEQATYCIKETKLENILIEIKNKWKSKN